MTSWYEVVDSRVVHDGWSRVRVDRVRMPDGAEVDREVVEHRSAVAVLPLYDDGTVVLLRQYRHPIGTYLLEVPAGVLDHDGAGQTEQPEVAARRELAEEVGLHAAELLPLTTFLNSAGWCDERTHVYLARGLSDTARPDGFVLEHEESDMEIVRLPLDEAVQAVHAGEITDAKTIIGVMLAARD